MPNVWTVLSSDITSEKHQNHLQTRRNGSYSFKVVAGELPQSLLKCCLRINPCFQIHAGGGLCVEPVDCLVRQEGDEGSSKPWPKHWSSGALNITQP